MVTEAPSNREQCMRFMMSESALPRQQDHEHIAHRRAKQETVAEGQEGECAHSLDTCDLAAASARSALRGADVGAFKDMSYSTSCGCCRCQETKAECAEVHSWHSNMLVRVFV